MGSKASKNKAVEKKPPKLEDLVKKALTDRGGHCITCPKKASVEVIRPSKLFGRFPTYQEFSVRVVCEITPNDKRRPFQGTDGVKTNQDHTFCTAFRRFLLRSQQERPIS